MGKLVKMEWYKLRTSKLFLILLGVIFALNTAFNIAVPMVSKIFSPKHTATPVKLSEAFSNPFGITLFLIPVFISVVSYLYDDFSGGYIKNIAGQVKNRGNIVFSKYIVIGIHNIIFFAVGALSNILGSAIAGNLVTEGDVFGGIMTCLLKWILSMSISAILIFMTMGMRNKTFASIIGVVLATGTLSLLYMGINALLANVFHIQDFNIAEYAPDHLMSSVDIVKNALVFNSIAVSIIFIAIFLTLTYMTFKKRDVK